MLPVGGWLCVYAVKICSSGTSLVVPWLRLRVSSAGDVGLIPGQRTKISHAKGCGQNHPPTPMVLFVQAPFKCTPVFPLHSMPWGSADPGVHTA